MWSSSDLFLRMACAAGLVLSVVVLIGGTNALVMAGLWFLYMSFVHVGQIFYGYGWEILLLETGFLAIFLCPLRTISPWKGAPPAVIIYLIRWLLFRVMFGAGLIKIRGDECWRDLTCLVYHYETQPIPNPLSWLLHHAAPWFHKLGVLYNHFVELIVPWGLFWPRRLAMWAAGFTIVFQLMLILSGNLSWLNWLTLSLCIACFDDRFFERFHKIPDEEIPMVRQFVAWGVCAIVVFLSLGPVANMLSRQQIMNTSFDRLHLVNTYGAFGSVGRARDEVILEGSDDRGEWREYEFLCAPGDLARRPCLIAPLQPRLDWQIWFAAMSRIDRQPWLLKLVLHLLDGDARLMAKAPFDHPPKYIRARLYRYSFTSWGEPGWWKRSLAGEYMPPVTKEELSEILGGATEDDD
jgi:hypothetical protein